MLFMTNSTQSFKKKKKKSILSNFRESVSTVASVSCSLSGAGCGPLLLQGSVCFQRCSSAYDEGLFESLLPLPLHKKGHFSML